jgi:PPOX class probable F420-dependent enzyme
MPGYGIADSDGGRALLPWSWAVERLTGSHDYWLATVRPDGRPHVMPVWGLWDDGALWFSSALASRKARNLAADPRCTATTDDARRPVVVEGAAARMRDPSAIERFTAGINAKYGTDYGVDFYDPDVNGCYRIRPAWVFALDDDAFVESPTRWRAEPEA